MEGKEKRGVIVQSVARALTMISCFANDTELGISEIAERMDLSKSTTYGLVNTLTAFGYLEQTENKKYRLGLKLFELGNLVQSRMDVRIGFIWGSNSIGQDLWARIWAGARTSLTIAFFVALIEAVVGITAGVLWGYVRGLDFVFTELYNIFDNIPTAIVLILISYVATPSIWTMVLGMAIKGWIEMARFIRNQILIIRDRDYNVASRCIGTPTIRIVLRNLLPYLVSVIMLRMALTIPEAIGNEVFITYIGLGLSVETPSLGNLVNDGRKVMMQAGLRYQLLYPTLILSFVTIAFYLIGNAFSDAADPKNHLQ